MKWLQQRFCRRGKRLDTISTALASLRTYDETLRQHFAHYFGSITARQQAQETLSLPPLRPRLPSSPAPTPVQTFPPRRSHLAPRRYPVRFLAFNAWDAGSPATPRVPGKTCGKKASLGSTSSSDVSAPLSTWLRSHLASDPGRHMVLCINLYTNACKVKSTSGSQYNNPLRFHQLLRKALDRRMIMTPQELQFPQT
ncbi:hypothetical protein PsorP6_009941 [Peronosclerospora sorghi]|uniref:Uncharacterized protein n=1 Tax=Peronosclerospora sorghi TaxID=230839 RepID=A0ACC0VVW8_9STRA|nr:hypothetical protein PsorP6_009941 [Peronosclerospora sorghi]